MDVNQVLNSKGWIFGRNPHRSTFLPSWFYHVLTFFVVYVLHLDKLLTLTWPLKKEKATSLLAQLRKAVREVINKCPFQNKATLHTYLTSRSATFPLLAQLKGQLRGKSSRLHSCLTQRAVSYVLVLAQLKRAVREIFIACPQKRRPHCIRIWQGSQPRFHFLLSWKEKLWEKSSLRVLRKEGHALHLYLLAFLLSKKQVVCLFGRKNKL